ncbi:hypothetical protein HDU77_011725 [Chytriomyces hyalinus]|nr:hypothetical protein HDU77_011725 [Chytriomyces hyalinus]
MIADIRLRSSNARFFAIDTGGPNDMVVKGQVDLEGVEGGVAALENVQIAVGIKGVAIAGENRTSLLAASQILFDSATEGPLSRSSLSFAVPLATATTIAATGLPPSFPLTSTSVTQSEQDYAWAPLSSADSASPLSVRYTIKAIVVYYIAGVKHMKETQAELFVLPPASMRALVLASQTPLSLANGDDGNLNTDLNYLLTIARRAVLPGGFFFAELDLFVPLDSPIRLSKSVLSLRSKLTVRNGEAIGDTSSAADSQVWASVSEAIQSSSHELSKSMKLAVPANVFCSLETTMFSYSYTLRLEIFGDASSIPVAVVDVPVVITQLGDLVDAGAFPRLARNTSNNQEAVSKHDLELNVVGMFTCLRSFKPIESDEIAVNENETMHIYHVYPDGMAFGENLTSRAKGLVPIHHLVESAYSGVKPPSVALSPIVPSAALASLNESTHSLPSLMQSPVSSKAETLFTPSFTSLPDMLPVVPAPTGPPPSYPASPVSPKKSFINDVKPQSIPMPPVLSQGRAPSVTNKKVGFFSKFKKNDSTTVSVLPVQAIVLNQVVSVETATAHLGLLNRFSLLEDKDQMVDWIFLCRAEQRYLMWLDLLRDTTPTPESMPLPPLDVALMWHSHMLNPLRYLEDCFFVFGAASAYSIPFARMHAVPGIDYLPKDGSIEVWEAFTREPFTIYMTDSSPFRFACIWCKGAFDVDPREFVYYRMKDTGIVCPLCHETSTASNVSAKRFINDCERFNMTGRIMFGSALDEKTSALSVAKATQDLSVVVPRDEDFYLQGLLSSTCSWDHVENGMRAQFTRLRMVKALKNSVRRSTVPKMFRAYKDIPVPLSLDLVSAVIRQRGFTGKMVGGIVDWCERDALPRATIRYRNFLALMKKEPGKFLVPTLDVDLMWHTHQCFPLQYQEFGLAELGRVINHDDSVESDTLNKSFNVTSKAWKRHYKEQYSAHQEEAKWFRRPAALVYPEYTRTAQERAVTVTRPTTNMQGGCAVHDPTPPPIASRRSAYMYPIGAPLGTFQTTDLASIHGVMVLPFTAPCTGEAADGMQAVDTSHAGEQVVAGTVAVVPWWPLVEIAVLLVEALIQAVVDVEEVVIVAVVVVVGAAVAVEVVVEVAAVEVN